MATTNIQSFAGDVEVSGELTVTGQLNSTTGSDKVKLTATTASETDYIPLSKGTTGAQPLYTDSNLTYNPANNVLAANLSGNVTGSVTGNVTGNVSGNVSGNAAFATNATYATSAGFATNATNANNANSANSVAFTDRDANNEIDYIAFVSSHSAGDKALYTDANLEYNPANNYINANVPYAATATNATYAGNSGLLQSRGYSESANASSIVARDASGHINMVYGFSSYLNMSHNTAARYSDSVFYSSPDNYIRKNTAAGMRSSLNVPTRTGGDASGTWSINVNGSAASATNATYAAHAGYAQSAGFATNATNATALTGYQFYDNGQGYARIGSQGSNKYLINWGLSGTIPQTSAYMTFRAAFGAIYSVVTTRNEDTSAASYAWCSGQISNTGFRIYSSGARYGTWYYIAVGR